MRGKWQKLRAGLPAGALIAFCLAAGVASGADSPSAGPAAPSAQSPSRPVTPANPVAPAAPTNPVTHATSAPPAKPEVTVLDNHDVEGILGREVRSETGEDMGRIVDVLVDRSGRVRAAIIDFGGFLGVGSRKIAIDWSALHFPPPDKTGKRITLELNHDQVNAAPQYQEGKPVVVLGALGKLEPLPFAD